jgi:carnitine-CoA ligase
MGFEPPPKSDWTTAAVCAMQARKYGNRIACSFADQPPISFRELDDESSAMASGLARLGVQRGDRVFALMRNSREFLVAMFGVHKRGAIFAPVNTELNGSFLEHQLRIANPRVIIVDDVLRSAVDNVGLDGLQINSTVIVGGEALQMCGSQNLQFAELVSSPVTASDIIDVAPNDSCTIMFTSGTTGPAKAVLMTQAHCFFFALETTQNIGLSDADCMYISMPLFHGTACFLQFYAALLSGATSHIVRRFSASSWLRDIKTCGATVTFAIGVMPEFILRQPERPDDLDNKLRVCWSVPVAQDVGTEFERRFGLRILQGYGMTEFTVAVWGALADPLEAGCAGHVLDGYFEVRIVDPDTDEFLGQGVTGEIVVRPKEPSVFMAGYYGMPEKTVEAWRNLWFHSGDAGYFDARGRLFYVDRIRDRIRRRGENVSSFEIENVIGRHPDVADCAVVGVRVDDAGGEDEVMALVVVSADLDPAAFLAWCLPKLPKFAAPRFVEFVEQIERTPTGKLRKQSLRERGVTSKTWDRVLSNYCAPNPRLDRNSFDQGG